MSNITFLIEKLRNQMIKHNIEGYLVSSSDEFNGEYISDHANYIKFISKFSGSNGLALITLDENYLFTDSRYTLQAKQESGEYFEIWDINKYIQIIQDIKLKIVGLDPKIFTMRMIDALEPHVEIRCIPLLDELWIDRPQMRVSTPYILPYQYHGEDFEHKNKKLSDILTTQNFSSFFTSDYHAICWLLNIRGQDLEYTPIIQMMMLWQENHITIFAHNIERFDAIKKSFSNVTFADMSKLASYLAQNHDLLVCKRELNYFIYQILITKNINFRYGDNPINKLKAIKNEYEIRALKSAQKSDTIAVNQFIHYVKTTDLSKHTEFTLQQKLNQFRAQQKNFISLSFSSIVGYEGNGAIVHYNPKESTAKNIAAHGLLLFDSGSQYPGATTDITRTISLGNPMPQEKLLYSLVLKGHIAISQIKFPYGTSGRQIEVIARQFLWQHGYDYGHSTGHGVGAGLSVHEGPHAISILNDVALEAGMIVTNEPGIYIEGQFGIRLENMLLIKRHVNNYLYFENLTHVDFDKNLYDYDILSAQDIKWLDEYAAVNEKLAKS